MTPANAPPRKVFPCVPIILESGEYKNPTYLAHVLAAAGKYYLVNSLATKGQLSLEVWDLIEHTKPRLDCPAVRRRFGAQICDTCPLRGENSTLRSLLQYVRRVSKDNSTFYVEVQIDDRRVTMKLTAAQIFSTIEAVLSGNEKKMTKPAQWAMRLYGMILGEVPPIITHEDAFSFAKYLVDTAEWVTEEQSEIIDALLEFIEENLEFAPYIKMMLPNAIPPLIIDEDGVYIRLESLRYAVRGKGLNPPHSLLSALGSLVTKSARIQVPDAGFLRYYFIPFDELKTVDKRLVAKIRKRLALLKEGEVLPAIRRNEDSNAPESKPQAPKEVDTYEI